MAKRNLLLLWLFVGVCAETPLATAGEPLRVMTFNVRYANPGDGEDRWELRKEFVVDVIDAFAPDVLGLQEPLPEQMRFLEDHLESHQLIGCGRRDGKRDGEFTAMLVRRDRFQIIDQGRFWFSDSPDVAGSMGWGAGLPRLCVWTKLADRLATGKEFAIYNTHFDHRSRESREKSGAMIARHIADNSADLPVVVMGDFNTSLESKPLQVLTNGEVPLVETWDGNEELARTAHGFKGARKGTKIDFVFASSQWTVIEADIVRTERQGRYPSDHFPVTAVLSWE